MPVGDSITVGINGSDPIGGFRDDLAAKLIAEGIIFDFVGDQQDGTGFDVDHEGHSGWRADQISTNIENWLDIYSPHIVLLHIGTNDISQDESPSNIINEIEDIIDKIYNYDNNIEILCSYLIPRIDSKDNITSELNHLIQDLVYEKQNANYKIYPVDQNWGFKSNPDWATDYMIDATHPNNNGYQKIAEVYFDGLIDVIYQQGSSITDNFNRESLGDDWYADPELNIVNDELANTSTSSDWNYLAIFKPGINPTWVSFKWGINVDSLGINNGGLALRLDSQIPDQANGYLAWISNSTAVLWLIENGAPSFNFTVDLQINIHPKAGDIFKVVMSSDDNGHHFDYIINDQFAGRVTDPNKHQGNAATLYAGAMLRGNHNNNIDDFTIYKEVDDMPPAAVTDLRIGKVTSGSAALLWTAPGDDGMRGNATSYDIRYSTSQITEANFSSTFQPPTSIPTPLAPGSEESFVITGLQSGETYYFALKTLDEVPNQSAISNVVSYLLPSPITTVDDFNRVELGADWSAGPEYKIISGELANSSTSDNWNLAIYNAQKNPFAVSFKFGTTADANGIEQGGLAFMIDTPSLSQSTGYIAWIRPSNQTCNMYGIENGQPSQRIGSAISISSPVPMAGDELKVMISTDINGHHFDFYVNDIFAGRIDDPDKLYGNTGERYAGVMLRGNLNNNIDDFTIYKGATDEIPPAAVTDLRIGNASSSFIKLFWTAPGDDGMNGIATSYDIRYSKNQITEANFSSAFSVSNALQPSAPGTMDSATVTGLSPDETYYFALKASDENDNQSAISNVVTGMLPSPVNAIDDFNREELGNNWNFDPEFKIISGELANTSTEDRWDFMAIYKARMNPFSASFKWGVNANADGINNGGLALMLDSPNPTDANGYLTWIHESGIYLWLIEGGVPSYQFTADKPITFRPKAGDVFKVIMSSDQSGHHFDYFVNNQLAGRLTDPNKNHGNASTLYSGVMLRGNRNNNIDDFTLEVPLGEVSNLVYTSGNNQSDVVNTKLNQPFVVTVTDQWGSPFPGITVNFTVTQGSGSPPPSVSPANPQTNANGEASTFLTLGTTAGTHKVQASVPGLSGSPVTFTAEATPGLADKIVYNSGNNQSGTVKTTLQQPFKIKIVDKFDNAIPNHKVHFKVTSGGGTLDGNSLTEKDVMTDSFGLAQVTLTLGSTLGVYTVEASSDRGGNPLTNSPITFTATAVVPKLVYVSGNDQKGAVGMPLNQPFVVKVADENGIGVVGFPVNFEVKQGGGTLKSSGPWYTEANGLVQVTLILGPEPSTVNKVWATAEWEGNPLPNSPMIFQAISGIVTTLSYVAGNGQTGSAGWPLEDSLRVKVTDSYGNTVGGYPVVFSSTEGDNLGTFSGTTDHEIQVITDSRGIAKALFYCGTKPGVASKAKAVATGLTGSPVNFNASVAELVELKYVAGNGQIWTVGAVLQEPLKAKVVDQKGRAIPNFPIKFSVVAGGGSFSGDSTIVVNTDYETKIAATTFKLGPQPGDNNNVVEATAVYKGNELKGSPIRYTASGKSFCN